MQEVIFKEQCADIYIAEETDPEEIADRIANKGHIGLMDWGEPQDMIYVMMGNGRDGAVARRMNRIKGRPEDQVLAISGFDDLVEIVGNPSESKALIHAAQRLDSHASPMDVIRELFRQPVGVVVPAKEGVPPWISTVKNGETKVMIAGQSHNCKVPYLDLYNQVVRTLAGKYNTFCAASSGNRSDLEVYTASQQVAAYADFRRDIDFFVMRRDVSDLYRDHQTTSCTAFDLGERASLKRWGSRDVRRFRAVLPQIDISKDVPVLPNAEILLIQTIFDYELHPALRWRLTLESMRRAQHKKAS